ncbi:hypothetical protein BDZ89DRAFT_295578 [Hymenopellis radicata]|nr:hypothetical protein BDZ89DRAFT_295578 [Hymenopellis radicata]
MSALPYNRLRTPRPYMPVLSTIMTLGSQGLLGQSSARWPTSPQTWHFAGLEHSWNTCPRLPQLKHLILEFSTTGDSEFKLLRSAGAFVREVAWRKERATRRPNMVVAKKGNGKIR